MTSGFVFVLFLFKVRVALPPSIAKVKKKKEKKKEKKKKKKEVFVHPQAKWGGSPTPKLASGWLSNPYIFFFFF